jgi:hypothetical protein
MKNIEPVGLGWYGICWRASWIFLGSNGLNKSCHFFVLKVFLMERFYETECIVFFISIYVCICHTFTKSDQVKLIQIIY